MADLTDKQKLEMWKKCPFKLGETVLGSDEKPWIIMDVVEWHSFSTWTMKIYDHITGEQRNEVLDIYSNQVLDENFVEV